MSKHINIIRQRRANTAREAHYIYGKVSCITNKEKTTDLIPMRIDTGADVTCIPKKYVKDIEPLITKQKALVRNHDGGCNRVFFKHAIIHLPCTEYDWIQIIPDHGILLTDSEIGLIGIDVLDNMNYMSVNGVMVMEYEEGDENVTNEAIT